MSRSRYALDVDPSRENNTHAIVVGLVGGGKRVLDIGCAEGDIARVLRGRGCAVSGVEYDAAAAERARPVLDRLLVGDVLEIDLVAELGERSFDVVILADVLEHLADPASVLAQARRLLAPGGYLVLSVPNVAHAALRLSLLLGQWEYRPTGLLDETHIRFFTRTTLNALLHQSGFLVMEEHRSVFGPFETEIPVPADALPDGVLERVMQDPDASTYQFIFTAVPDDADGRVQRILRDRALAEEQYAEALRELAEVRQALGEARAELVRLARREQESAAALTAASAASADLARRDAENARLRADLERVAEQLGQSTQLLRREERSVVKPFLRRVYGGARAVGRALPPEAQQQLRAALSPVAARVAPGSAQADAYSRAARRSGAAPALLPAAGRGAAAALPPGRPGAFDVVVLPVIDWHFRIQRPQHLADQLSRLGHRVVYLSTELERLRPGGRAYSLLEHVQERVWLARLTCPAPLPRIYRDPLAPHQVTAVAEALQALVEELQLSSVVLIAQHPFWEPVMWASGQHLLAYDLMDEHSGFEGTAPWVLDAEARLVQGVDLVTVTAPSLAEKAPGSVVVRNAAEVDRFSATPDVVRRTGRPTVGYFGAIAHWFDTALVARCARERPQWDFVLIGSTVGAVGVDELRGLPNVRLLGELPYPELPSHLYGFDVCLIPFHIIPLTEHTNPVKAYEYLSAGKPVVSTDMPEVRLMQPHVHVAQDHDAFLVALDAAMGEAGDEGLAQVRRQWAAQHSWRSRAELVERAVEERLPAVSVVVLCYNNLDFTKACLDSLDRGGGYPGLELVLVDNASSDGTPAYLREYARDRPNVRLVLNEENLGFAGGNNVGLAAATGEVLVMLNNDTVVTEGWALGLARHLRDDPTLGLVGPVTNNIGNEAKVDVVYDSLADLEHAARQYTSVRYRQLLRVPTVAFFCVALRREAYEKVGGLDEDFGIGFFEDDDYCRRVQAAGYDIAIAEDVFVHHHLSASFDALGAARKQELFERSKAVYEKKWGQWTPHTYRPGERA